MDKIRAWWQRRRPSARRLAQLYAAVLYNAHIRGFIEGKIYTGPAKAVCAPGLNCYSCPGAIAACPLGALQNAVAASASRPAFYVVGMLMLFGLTLGRVICENHMDSGTELTLMMAGEDAERLVRKYGADIIRGPA